MLVAIPHFFDPAGGGRHSSRRPERPQRVRALTECLTSLYGSLGRRQAAFDLATRLAHPANTAYSVELDVVVVTTGESHALADLAVPRDLWRHEPTDEDGWMLGFACRRVLAAGLGRYDLFALMEDDLVLADALLLRKLAWFREMAGDERLLLPNRFECGSGRVADKVYVDGDLAPSVVAPHVTPATDPASLPDLEARALGAPVRFAPARNPHAACWFLSAAQMERLAAAPAFQDRETSFVGPLESGITRPLMATFRIYKPAPENAAFLEVRHFGTGFLSQLRPLPNG